MLQISILILILVQFMPLSMDSLVASGAGDCRVKILSVEHANIPDSQPSFQCSCHAGRVKRLAVAPDVPYLLWSGNNDLNNEDINNNKKTII